jgi:large subunit ribosomal protein L18
MNITKLKAVRLSRRVCRIRKRVGGTSERPRLAVERSHRNIAAQLIDDVSGKTLCALSTRSKGFRDEIGYGGNSKAAALLGKALAERAEGLGIKSVCLDRRGRKYHGRIKALAEAARKAGLKF